MAANYGAVRPRFNNYKAVVGRAEMSDFYDPQIDPISNYWKLFQAVWLPFCQRKKNTNYLLDIACST